MKFKWLKPGFLYRIGDQIFIGDQKFKIQSFKPMKALDNMSESFCFLRLHSDHNGMSNMNRWQLLSIMQQWSFYTALWGIIKRDPSCSNKTKWNRPLMSFAKQRPKVKKVILKQKSFYIWKEKLNFANICDKNYISTLFKYVFS